MIYSHDIIFQTPMNAHALLRTSMYYHVSFHELPCIPMVNVFPYGHMLCIMIYFHELPCTHFYFNELP